MSTPPDASSLIMRGAPPRQRVRCRPPTVGDPAPRNIVEMCRRYWLEGRTGLSGDTRSKGVPVLCRCSPPVMWGRCCLCTVSPSTASSPPPLPRPPIDKPGLLVCALAKQRRRRTAHQPATSSKVLESVGADYELELIEKAVSELNGKDINDLIEQ